MPACPNCQHNIRATDAACRYCGAALSPTVPPDAPQRPESAEGLHWRVYALFVFVVLVGIVWVM